MRESSSSGRNRDLRSSALWGTGGRGGDSRSSALWGKGGRGFVLTAVAVLALAAPLAGTAAPYKTAGSSKDATYVAPNLTDKAKKHPDQLVKVIVQSTTSTADAKGKARALGALAKVGRDLDLVNGVTVELPAKLIDKLAKVPGLTITPDAPVKLADYYSNAGFSTTQVWPVVSGASNLWGQDVTWGYGNRIPAIAIVDSGIQAGRSDFGNRIVANVNLSTLANNSAGDGRGHGTFVADIAAGSGGYIAGAAPKAPIVSLDVMDDQGMALTSDVIAAANWIAQNKATYNIKVANFSLHSTSASNFTHDPLDQAVEKLWLGGVTVVAAAGNYGNTDGTPSGVRYAPGNDPFVITVGASDTKKTLTTLDDGVAPWSAYGHTYDGFQKPEISAPGRYMLGAVPSTATLASDRPDKVVYPGYMQLSGTSFSAPVVSGTVAYLLAAHPTWTPDQVKGALMATARPLPLATNHQGGVGQLNALAAIRLSNPGNPNAGLDRFVGADPNGGSTPVFDAVSWTDAAKADVSWDSVSWTDVSWTDVSWTDVSWTDVSWTDVSWTDVSWTDVSWTDVSWTDSALEDAVTSEPLDPDASLAAATSGADTNAVDVAPATPPLP